MTSNENRAPVGVAHQALQAIRSRIIATRAAVIAEVTNAMTICPFLNEIDLGIVEWVTSLRSNWPELWGAGPPWQPVAGKAYA